MSPFTSPFVDWPDGDRLVLASRSPRRALLLETAGLPFEAVPASDVESLRAVELEREVALGAITPADYAETLAAAKAEDVAAGRPGSLVLGADTVVILEGEILEKPRDAEEARVMLGRLSGRTHTVISAMALRRIADGVSWTGHAATKVEFLPLSTDAVARYVDTGEPMDKAGAYGIQGYGAMMIAGIEGCYFNVMGLPLALLGQALRGLAARESETT